MQHILQYECNQPYFNNENILQTALLQVDSTHTANNYDYFAGFKRECKLYQKSLCLKDCKLEFICAQWVMFY